jgi:hypothetical protein
VIVSNHGGRYLDGAPSTIASIDDSDKDREIVRVSKFNSLRVSKSQ